MSRGQEPCSALVEAAQHAAITLLAELEEGIAVLVCTVDGLTIGHAGPASISTARLAALAASWAEWGEKAAHECRLGAPRGHLLETHDGRIFLRSMHVRGVGLAAMLVTTRHMLQGTAWHAMARIEHMVRAATGVSN